MYDVFCVIQKLTIELFRHLKTSEHEKEKEVHIIGVDLDRDLIDSASNENTEGTNISFQMCNMMDPGDRKSVILPFLKSHDKVRFDLVFVFAVTSWIHLNHGDEGLREFLRYVSSITNCLIIECQRWKNYKTSARRIRRVGGEPYDHFPKLIWRENVVDEIQNYLEKECEMTLLKKFGETANWSRDVCLYQKKQNNS